MPQADPSLAENPFNATNNISKQGFPNSNYSGRHKGTEGQRHTEMKTYRDLLVWQKAMVLVTEIYGASKAFPQVEVYGLTSQLRRCAVSIPSNMAEGYGRHSTQDYLRFLQIAAGSLYELQTQVEISRNPGYLGRSEAERLYALSREIERMLSSSIHKLR